MERIILKHLSGSKANQVEEFPLNHVKELVFGRDPSATVKYDPERDDLVGRQHAKIEQDAADPSQFTITDLQSRNGTYINKQRIVGTVKIAPGDLIQLGPGGPEAQFDIEPRPAASAVRPTREAATNDPQASTLTLNPFGSVPTTRTVDTTGGASTPDGAPRTTVGKATVERMITETVTQTKKTEGRRYMMIGGAALAAVLLVFGVIAAVLVYRSRSSEAELSNVQKQMASAPMTDTEVVAANKGAVVKVEGAWRLISPTGGPVYHLFQNNVRDAKKGTLYVSGQPKTMNFPCYVKLNDETYEPYLTYANDGYSLPIGGSFAGSGFVVTTDGFILTTRNIAAGWENSYPLQEDFEVAFIFDKDKKGIIETISKEELMKKLKSWVPAQTKQKMDELGGRYEGKNDSLYVSFPGLTRRIAAQVTTTSDEHDAALIRVNLPNALQKVETYDNYGSIRQGDKIIMIGYSTSSEPVYLLTKAKEDTGRGTEMRELPDPTMAGGSIGRLPRGQDKSGKKENIVNVAGDFYQLTINSSALGNSGSPIFDSYGRVIAIFSTGRQTSTSFTYAVPIRYGMELLNTKAE
ncbi:MAG TPA: FHA domain-containing protein [Pyrinomonadaceae bacterium]|jgi:pSer/pThr/pTyr-binding forkhead associated (FHA) protein